MHTLHYIAVEADSKQEAFESVQVFLEPSEEGYRQADWSDWHVVGGGRWNSSGSQYDDSSSDVISYAEDTEKWNEAIEGIRKSRINEMNTCLERMDTDKFKSDIVDYISEGGDVTDDIMFNMNSYYMRKPTQLLSGYWIPESYFYDSVYGSASFRNLNERVKESPENQYLVPVDFHF